MDDRKKIIHIFGRGGRVDTHFDKINIKPGPIEEELERGENGQAEPVERGKVGVFEAENV